ncbi:uncharacterized protein LOC103316975 [Nasonia vitripennis]|uniref:Uncharacterized protein n=1 Tax=Nasonia vitripennis TaxID=7425 RepID=A0A7M7ITD7_NASVI|nr:uncharacterized protein LOC103316975 [Nasonia vitripennis]
MRPRRGFTKAELVAALSELHGLQPSRRFRRQVALALRRGLDYGILAKSGNEYRFDPVEGSARRTRQRRRKEARPGVPRPTVPPPPDLRPKPRDLTREPFRVIRHRRPGPRR